MLGIDGSRGSYKATNAGLVFVGCLDTFLSATCLGIALALAMAPAITPRVYSLERSISFSSVNLCSLAGSSEQTLFILRDKENGIESRHSIGWQLEGNKY